MPASPFFFGQKLCKFAMRSQCFFKAENLSVSVFFLTIKQLQHLESYLPSVEFMKTAICGKMRQVLDCALIVNLGSNSHPKSAYFLSLRIINRFF